MCRAIMRDGAHLVCGCFTIVQDCCCFHMHVFASVAQHITDVYTLTISW